MFHLSTYAESLALVTNSDVDAVEDTVLQRRNAHLLFSEDFNLIAAYANGSTLSRMRFGNISLSLKGQNHIWPVEPNDANQRYPAIMDLRDYPMKMPLNEEITLEATTTGAGPVVTRAHLWLAKPQWSRNLPPGELIFNTRATAVVTAGTETTWTALAALAFERDLANGVYAVVGAHVVATGAVAFRMFFPSATPIEGRQLRPGGLVQEAGPTPPWPAQTLGLGEWGRFSSFEPPSIQVSGDAAGGTYEVRLNLVFLGTSRSLLR